MNKIEIGENFKKKEDFISYNHIILCHVAPLIM
jgi:hypothetical protein